MSITYTADVFCDKCSDWVHGATGHKPAGLARPALKAAKAAGWSRDVKSEYTDLCPTCLTQERRSKPQASANPLN